MVNQSSYDLISNGCLMLASKFEELDINIPMIIDFLLVNKFRISYNMLKGI